MTAQSTYTTDSLYVITTKRAKQGETRIDFSATFTVQPYSLYKKMYADAATLVGLEAAVWTAPEVKQVIERDYILIELMVDDKTPLPDNR